jgi:basic membrane protein A
MRKILGALLALSLFFVSCGEETTASTDEIIKAGFIYVGPPEDVGWTAAHDQARIALDEKYDWLETTFVESVPEGAEAVSYIERLISSFEPDIVFTTSFGFMDPTLEVAANYPDIIFEHCSGFKRADNVGTYFGDLYQMYYLNGMLAAALSKTGQLGYVAAFPIPELFRHINAYALGARAVNPEATVDVNWTYAWYGPDQAKEAAEALIARGVDALAFTEDTPATIEVTEKYTNEGKTIYSFAHYSPMFDYGPKSVLSGQIIDWTPIYDDILTRVKNGTWESGDIWWLAENDVAFLGADLENPINPLYIDELKAVPYGDSNVYEAVMDLYEKMQNGREPFDPFMGPITNNAGEIMIPEGSMASIGDLATMSYYVEGVLGSIPE